MQCSLNDIPDLGLMGIVMHRVMQMAKSRYQEFDLNWSQASILFTLHDHSSMSQKALASQFNMSPPAITSAIQKLERGGYLARTRSEQDERVVTLSLTGGGRQALERAGARLAHYHELLERLPAWVKENVRRGVHAADYALDYLQDQIKGEQDGC